MARRQRFGCERRDLIDSKLDAVDDPRSPASMCHNVAVSERHNGEEPSAMHVIAIGLDLAKPWFQVHGVSES
jgi:hypothetical protein